MIHTHPSSISVKWMQVFFEMHRHKSTLGARASKSTLICTPYGYCILSNLYIWWSQQNQPRGIQIGSVFALVKLYNLTAIAGGTVRGINQSGPSKRSEVEGRPNLAPLYIMCIINRTGVHNPYWNEASKPAGFQLYRSMSKFFTPASVKLLWADKRRTMTHLMKHWISNRSNWRRQ